MPPNGTAGGRIIAPRHVITLWVAVLALLAPLAAAGLAPPPAGAPASAVPAIVEGYTITPLAPLAAATAATFGPDDALYVTTLAGDVQRIGLDWSAATGPVATDVTTFASDFSLPLGLAFGPDGALYVSDSDAGEESGRVDGRVTRVDDEGRTVVVSGLPNGRHNTNNLRFGPDGRLYITNGNPNDNGVDGGEVDVFPYSGAILSVDAAEVTASPAVLRWVDESGAFIPADQIATHPRNDDFNAKVDVLAWGFRNVYDVAFSASGAAYTATNGADEPSSQDLLYKITPGTDYGFPFCYNVGVPGGTRDAVTVEPNPVYGDAARCEGVPPATALLGWHVCATGLDFPNGPGFGDALYVAECGPFFAPDLLVQTTDHPEAAHHNTGHKVVRVELDENGEATLVRDFVTGLTLPVDVVFGPDHAMYVIDLDAVYRVSPIAPPVGQTGAPAPVEQRVVAAPGAVFAGYATPVVATPVGGPVTFVNADILRHNVVALDAYGPDDQPWCNGFAPGRCPLFWSKLVGLAATTPVLGLENLEEGQTYTYYCTLHPGMRGTLVALSAGA